MLYVPGHRSTGRASSGGPWCRLYQAGFIITYGPVLSLLLKLYVTIIQPRCTLRPRPQRQEEGITHRREESERNQGLASSGAWWCRRAQRTSHQSVLFFVCGTLQSHLHAPDQPEYGFAEDNIVMLLDDPELEKSSWPNERNIVSSNRICFIDPILTS